MLVRAKAVLQLLREFWFAIAFAVIVTIYGPAPDNGWTTWTVIATLWAALVSFGWLTVQWVRVMGKLRTDDKLGDIASQLSSLVGDLRVTADDINGHVTGGRGMAYVYGLPDQRDIALRPHLAVKGEYTQRDVTVTVREVPFDNPTKPLPGKRLKVGDVIAGHYTSLPADILDGAKDDERRLFITLQGLNGTAQQFLHLRKVDGEWRFATRLMAHQFEVLVYVQPGFPQQPDWIEDMRLSGVQLGGPPYDPLPG